MFLGEKNITLPVEEVKSTFRLILLEVYDMDLLALVGGIKEPPYEKAES